MHVSDRINEAHCLEILTEWSEKGVGRQRLVLLFSLFYKGQLFPWEESYLIGEIGERKGNELPTFMSAST